MNRTARLLFVAFNGAGLWTASSIGQQLPAQQAVQDLSTTATAPAVEQVSPPNAPVVTCNGDQITISADNSTISSILTRVQTCIGVELQLPPGYQDQRTFVHLGPGGIRQILDDLLDSTDMNYMIASSNATAGKILSVSLTIRPLNPGSGEKNDGPMASDGTLTPARRAWLAGLNALKRGAPLPDNEEPGRSPEAAPESASSLPEPAQDSAKPAPASVDTHPADHAEAAPLGGSPSTGSSQASAATSTEPASADAAKPPTSAADANTSVAASPALRKQIDQMQQMFQERKNMIADHGNSSQPN